MATWMCFSDIAGKPFPMELLIKELAAHGFQATFLQVARLACIAANSEGGPRGALAAEFTTDLLSGYRGSLKPLEGIVADHVKAQPATRGVLHEQAAHALLALAALHSGEQGPEPSFAKVAFWLLVVNDYLPEWAPASRPLDSHEDAVAEFWRVTRYNHGNHLRRDVLRGALLFREPPPRGPLPGRWEELQHAAFGMAYDKYAADLAGPVTLLSSTWGTPGEDTRLRSPVLQPRAWCGGSEAHAQFFESRTWSRDEAIASFAASLSPHGVPRNLGAFAKYPFLRRSESEVAVASPWAVRSNFRLSTWAAYRAAERGLSGSSAAWPPGFGDLLEAWCRRVAVSAGPAVLEASGTRIILSKSIGSADEVEDVILTDGHRVALFAVKASLAPESIAATTCAKEDVIAWLERFLFAKRDGAHRGGVLRQLDAKCRRIRSGVLWPDVSQGPIIIPLVVTFEHLGDTFALYSWIRRRCDREGLFSQADVRMPTVMNVAEFELMMALAASGGDVLGRLGRWERGDEVLTTERLLRDLGERVVFQELPLFRDGFRDLFARSEARLRSLADDADPQGRGQPPDHEAVEDGAG